MSLSSFLYLRESLRTWRNDSDNKHTAQAEHWDRVCETWSQQLGSGMGDLDLFPTLQPAHSVTVTSLRVPQFPDLHMGRRIPADGSCPDVNALHQAVCSGTGGHWLAPGFVAQGVTGRVSGEGPCTSSHPGLTPRRAPTHQHIPPPHTALPRKGFWQLPSRALTFEWPSRRSLWNTWQNFQQSTAFPDSGSRFTTDQKVCAPFSWCVPKMHGGGWSRKHSSPLRW